MADDVFCKIIAGLIPANPVYQDDDVIVVNDKHPSAPVHMLVIPKKHLASLEDFVDADAELLGRMLLVAQRVARDAGLSNDGYRITVNVGMHGGQSVPHFHVHVKGGRQMKWGLE